MKPFPSTAVLVNSMVGAELRRRTAVAAILLLRLPHPRLPLLEEILPT